MNKFVLNGAGIIEHARYAANVEHSGCLTDHRFAVINGLMFELMTNELDDGYSVTVCVFDANEVYNPSHGDDIVAAYGQYMVGFEYFVSEELCNQDNQLCIDAERNGDALFLHLIEHALKDSNNARARFNNFTRGLDLDHIQGVA